MSQKASYYVRSYFQSPGKLAHHDLSFSFYSNFTRKSEAKQKITIDHRAWYKKRGKEMQKSNVCNVKQSTEAKKQKGKKESPQFTRSLIALSSFWF